MAQDNDAPQLPDIADEVIDRLYEVAVDPTRYEALLDRWEAMMSPQRRAANDPAATAMGLKQFESHILRADRVLDRVLNTPGVSGPEAMLAQVDRAAAFTIDRNLRISGVNTAAASALGVTKGASVSGIALAEGEPDMLAARIARLINGNSDESVLIRSRSARFDRVVMFNLAVVRPPAADPFVIAVTSELGWPVGFDDVLRHAFDLTQAETEVVRALTEGQSLSQIGESRDRSVETIRAQLKSVMAKTETRTQSELVRLTLSTMELAHYSEDAAADLPTSSTGFDTLEPRPFQTLRLHDGRRLDYLILGDPDGKPVMFFPLDYGLIRWPASAEAEAARRGLKIIVAVRPGYGASSPVPKGVPYIAQVTDDLAALLDTLKTGPVPFLTLGGDSFIAIAFQAAYPGRMTALIACGGVLPLTRPEQYERMDKWHRFILAGARYTPHLLPFMVKAGFALARRLGKRGFVHAVYGKSAADVATFEIPEVFEAMVCGSDVSLSETHSAHDAFSREVISHETTDWTEEINALKNSGIPVHFLNGLQCPQVPPATLAEYQQDYPWINFRVYPDAGQLVFFLKWRDALSVLERCMSPN
jgi:pimeloyl-ACP methyl ester carboxylesterase/DNA-binding CsgD family transcriptional regulator